MRIFYRTLALTAGFAAGFYATRLLTDNNTDRAIPDYSDDHELDSFFASIELSEFLSDVSPWGRKKY